MDIDKFKLILKNVNSRYLYKIFIPSLKTDYCFLPLTVGQKKTISKFLLQNSSDSEDLDTYKALVAMISNLCQDQLDLNSINEIDKTLILAEIYRNNTLEMPKYSITCNQCKNEYIHQLNLDSFIEKLKAADLSNKEFKITKSDVEFKFIFAIPSIISVVNYQEYIKNKKEEILKNQLILEEEKLKILANYNEYSYKNEYPVLFVKEVYLNEEKVEGYSELSLEKKFEFFDDFEKDLIFGNDGLYINLISDYSDIVKSLHYVFECPNCKLQISEILSFESFFYFSKIHL